MPNYVRNIVKMKGIADLPLYSGEDGERAFDFNKLIPMPPELEMESGSRTEQCILYFLTERCTIPVKELDAQKMAIVNMLVDNVFAPEGWPEEVFNRAKKWTSESDGAIQDAAYEDGRQYVSNYEKYGSPTWYEWRYCNWGTKWNAHNTVIIDADTIIFDTAWSNPMPVIRKLCELYPDRRIEHWWADENAGHNTGHCILNCGSEQVHRYNGGRKGWAIYQKCWNMEDKLMKKNLIEKTVDGIKYNTNVDLCISSEPVFEEGFAPFGWFQLWRTSAGHYYFFLEADRSVIDCEKDVLFFTPSTAGDAFYWLSESMQLDLGLCKPEGCSDATYEEILRELSAASDVDIEELRWQV